MSSPEMPQVRVTIRKAARSPRWEQLWTWLLAPAEDGHGILRESGDDKDRPAPEHGDADEVG